MIKERLWLDEYKEEIAHIYNYFSDYIWSIHKENKYSYTLTTITPSDATISIQLLDGLNGFWVLSKVSKEFICKVMVTQGYRNSSNYDLSKPINNKETLELKHYGFSELKNNFCYNIHNSFPEINKMLTQIETIGKNHIIFL